MVMLVKHEWPEELRVIAAACQGRYVAETKEDGDRMRMRVVSRRAQLWNRRGDDVTFRYPEFHGEVDLPDGFYDGEMCVFIDGVSNFNDGISHRTHLKDPAKIRQAVIDYPVTYVLFDVLELNKGQGAGLVNIRGEKLRDRRGYLEVMDLSERHPNLQMIESSMDIMGLWRAVIERGGEGIVIKDLESVYHEGKRRPCWVAFKDVHESDVVFTSYEVNNKGIRLVNDETGIKCQCSGAQHLEVRDALDRDGKVMVTIRHLKGKTENDKYRQPTFMKLVMMEGA